MSYRVVTGWYPCKNTADKIIGKVKAKFSKAVIKAIDGYFTVVIDEELTLDEAFILKEKCIKSKIFCGVEVCEY